MRSFVSNCAGIPINKSLYTISYMLITTSTAGITFCVLYLMVSSLDLIRYLFPDMKILLRVNELHTVHFYVIMVYLNSGDNIFIEIKEIEK